jgi:hypothetical protein
MKRLQTLRLFALSFALAVAANIFGQQIPFGVAGVYAHQKPVKMTFSGTAAPSTINLQIPDTNTAEYNFRRERHPRLIHLS